MTHPIHSHIHSHTMLSNKYADGHWQASYFCNMISLKWHLGTYTIPSTNVWNGAHLNAHFLRRSRYNQIWLTHTTVSRLMCMVCITASDQPEIDQVLGVRPIITPDYSHMKRVGQTICRKLQCNEHNPSNLTLIKGIQMSNAHWRQSPRNLTGGTSIRQYVTKYVWVVSLLMDAIKT